MRPGRLVERLAHGRAVDRAVSPDNGSRVGVVRSRVGEDRAEVGRREIATCEVGNVKVVIEGSTLATEMCVVDTTAFAWWPSLTDKVAVTSASSLQVTLVASVLADDSEQLVPPTFGVHDHDHEYDSESCSGSDAEAPVSGTAEPSVPR